VLLDSIRTQLDSLSKSERKVALAVLASPNGTVSQNITALARAAQVSEPTVVRFCRTLGYDGWHEFKLKLAQGLALALPGASEQPAQDDLAADLVNKICSRSINTLLDLRNNLKPELIQQALDILSRANKIEFYGQGTSGFVAADAQHKFFRSGVPTVAYTDPAIHSIAAALLREGDAWWRSRSAATTRPGALRQAGAARRRRGDRAGAVRHAAGGHGQPADPDRPGVRDRSLHADLGAPGLPGGHRRAGRRPGAAARAGVPQEDAECAEGAAGIRHAVRFLHRDELLALATLRRPCTLEVELVDSTPANLAGVIEDVYTEAGAEYMRLRGGPTVRLDRIHSLNGQPFS
jgi:RpiR family carbohydrate utilization transcriptional regulator